jgi:hypothetical protein
MGADAAGRARLEADEVVVRCDQRVGWVRPDEARSPGDDPAHGRTD